MKKTENHLLVIFGASGDLTARKLIPALFNLYVAKQLPKNFTVLGASRSNLTDEEFRDRVVHKSPYLEEKLSDLKEAYIRGFSDMLFYEDLGSDYTAEYSKLNERIQKLNVERGTDDNMMFYLSTPPNLYEAIAENLAQVGLNNQDAGWKRLIVEKPFGYSLETAKNLNRGLQRFFKEPQIYRIDHYLGKETVQNLLVTR
ncbi:MAG: glucose-6-phosphate dehydrogenase, partial [Bacteroidota bacterium]